MTCIGRDAFEALVRLLCKDLKFFFLKCSHVVVDESFEARVLKNLQKWKRIRMQCLFFSELSLFVLDYTSFMTLSCYDLSLFGLLIMGDAFLTGLDKNWLLLC